MPFNIPLILILLCLAMLLLAFWAGPLPLYWVKCRSMGLDVSFRTLVRLRLQRKDVNRLVCSTIIAADSRLGVSLESLEAHADAGGNPVAVVNSLICAKYAKIPLTYSEAARLDLAGEDPVQRVREQAEARQPTKSPSNWAKWLMSRQPPASKNRPPRDLSRHWFLLPGRERAIREEAERAGVSLGGYSLRLLYHRGLNPQTIVRALIQLKAADAEIPVDTFVEYASIGGNIDRLVSAYAAAAERGVSLDGDGPTTVSVGGVDPMCLVEAVALARSGGWLLTSAEAAELVYADQDPVEFVRTQLKQRSAQLSTTAAPQA